MEAHAINECSEMATAPGSRPRVRWVQFRIWATETDLRAGASCLEGVAQLPPYGLVGLGARARVLHRVSFNQIAVDELPGHPQVHSVLVLVRAVWPRGIPPLQFIGAAGDGFDHLDRIGATVAIELK